LKLLVYIGILISTTTLAQKQSYNGFPSLVWPTLYSVGYETGSDQFGSFQKPVFNDKIKRLEGKSVVLPGYIVPFNAGMKSKEFMFTSLPLNACFFCGVGGPETVVQVFANDNIAYTDKPVEIRGILRLNGTDPDKMIYILEKAELLGEIEL
jgi:hypothetical protein